MPSPPGARGLFVVAGNPEWGEVAWAAEIFVALVGQDETFMQTVHARYHYDAREIVWHAPDSNHP